MSESTGPEERAAMLEGRVTAPEKRTGAAEEAATTPEPRVTVPERLKANSGERTAAAAEREAAPDGRAAVVGPTRPVAVTTSRAAVTTRRPVAVTTSRSAVTTRRPVAEAPGAVPPQGPEAGSVTPEAAVAALAADGPRLPFLIGVRHHAPSLTAAVPALLDAAAPDVLLVELPAEFQPWLGWLAHEETRAPVALAAVPAAGVGAGGERGPAFYPFADFSPELAALRWAARNGVPAVACDLPLADRAWARGGPGAPAPAPAPGADSVRVPGEGHGLSTALRSRLTGREGDDLWDRLVEAPAPGSSPEALRRAALLTGWALRYEAEARYGVDGTDLVREACMRDHIAAALANGQRPAVVVGAFHTPALLSSALPGAGTALPAPGASDTSEAPADATYAPADTPDAAAGAPTAPAREPGERAAGSTEAACTVSLIPYTYPLLDSRSGYPAGIRDPEWQHTVLDAAGDPAALHEALIRTAVRVCAALREQGHPYGPADGREVVRVAGDLARLRDLPAPGRGEFLEAVQTVLGRGETYGTGRAVAHALERVLVGTRTGHPTPAAPRSGLGPAVEAETEALSLPGPADTAEKAPRDLRLDPARSALDGRRELLLRRLTVCGIPYAQEQEVTSAAGSEGLTTRWQVRWTPATAAMLTAAGARGVTPAQAAEGVLRGRHAAEHAEGGPTAAQVVRGLTEAAECGLPALAEERLTELAAVLPASGTLPELLAGLDLLDRVAAGHLPGLAVPRDPSPSDTPDALAALPARLAHAGELLTSAAVRQVDGLTGSDEPEDARALLELAQRADRVGGIRLADALTRLAADGTPLIAAAAGAVRVLTGHERAETFGVRVASWVDAAVDSPSRSALTARLTGVLTAAGPLLTVGVAALDPLLHRVVELDDAAFLARLPALRGGFDTLSPAARDRLLDTVEERLGERVELAGADDPAELARRAVADLAARDLLARLGLPVPSPGDTGGHSPATHTPAPAQTAASAPTDGSASAPPSSAPDTLNSAPAPAASATGAPPSAHATITPSPADPAHPHPRTAPEATRTGTGTTQAPSPETGPDAATVTRTGPATTPARTLAPADRWRLVLGRRPDQLPPGAARLATALDELYGAGRGEGSRGGLPMPGQGRGGREASFPGVREWSEELAALFGPGVREEVLAAAAATGRQDVLSELDPAAATPSVELLRTVLRYAGGLPEARLAALRPLVRRLVDELTRQLATRLRPALTGTMQARPTRRPGGRLDLPRTLRANLATARRTEDGTVQVVPEKPVFRSRARRSADWRLILVTDVSGSMEASTIWSALTASVLAGVPTLSTHFLAFSTEVVDLTGHVHDPLSLLLEVSVGGGTHIAAGLRHARSLITVPSRTLVVVISDFEEGAPLGGLLSEVRALVATGCHVLGCASLDDAGRPRYSTGVAGQLVAAGMPVAALSPLELARWIGEKTA
ncbi:vWA domain-containing protein [Streptomyces bacillaris]|uniref:vWA domain-containing protein n=1 Tax=Streptomyces bacillaris TaxID=68179 RepID=UPI003D72B808